MATTKEILAWSKRAWARQDQWAAVLDEAYSYALPHRNVFNGKTASDGQLKMEKVFDSTALISTPRAAGRLQRDLMPPFERNAILEPGPAVPEEEKDALAKDLAKITELGHTVLAHSEFATASHECYFDLLSGRCNMKMLRGDRQKPVRFIAVPRAFVAIEEGAFGAVEKFFEKKSLCVDVIEKEYPGAKIPKGMKDQDKGGDTEFELIEATWLEDGKWKSCLIWEREQARLWETKYRRTGPWICARYMKVPSEHDGRGPLLMALPDMRTLNKTIEMLLAAAALAIAGIYTTTDDGIVNLDTVTIAPGVFLQVESNGSGTRGPSIKALETGRDYSLAQLVIERLQDSIKQILIDSRLPPETGAVRSPTEIAAKMKELAQDTGSAFGRLQQEWVVPIWQRMLDILSDPAIGLINDITIDQLFVRCQVTSPIARVQKLEDVKAYGDLVTMLQAMGGPQLVMLGMKIENAPDYLATRLGVPASELRSNVERQKMQQMVAGIIAAQAQAQDNAPAPAPAGAAA